MWQVMVICLLLASGQALLLEELGDQHVQCTWGAQYWCSSIATADACGKTDWCSKNHWPYQDIQDVPCSVMQQLVTNVRSLDKISSHSFLTHNEIAVYIVKGCTLLHDDESRNQCKRLITDEDIVLKLLSLVRSDLSPQSVATAVGVCRRNIPNDEQGSVVKCEGVESCGTPVQNVNSSGTEEQIEGAGPTCFICQLVIQKLETMLAKNTTEKQIETALQKVCNFLPSLFRQKCSALVSKYTPKLVELLLRYPPGTVCSVLQLCSDTSVVPVNDIQQSANVNKTRCFLCKLIINQVKSMLSDHTTQDEIKAALEKVCDLLPPFFKSVCNNAIETYEPQLIQMLLSSFTAEQICARLNMCTDMIEIVSETQQSANTKDTGCLICKFIINQVKSMLSDHTTQDEIKAALEKVCQQLPPIFQSMCNKVVETYEPQLIQMLLSSFTAEQICARLNMCTDVPVPVNDIQQSANVNKTRCFLCKLIINQVKSMLSDHTTQDEIKAALEKVCDLLPPFFKSVCNNVIETYEPQLIQMLLSSFTAEQICARLNMCTDMIEIVSETQQSANTKDTGCLICKFIINQVKSMLSDHTTQDEIKAALEKVCQQLPPIFQSMCNKVVETYEPQLIQMLLSSFTAEQICARLNMCTDVPVPVNDIQQSANVNKTRCFLCKLIINQVKSMLSDHTTQDEIKAALEKVCDLLPPFFKSVCNNVIETYEPQLIQMLLSSFTAEQICARLNMCTDMIEIVSETQQSANTKDTGCLICKFIINQVKSMLSDHTTQDEIKAALEKVCQQLPPIFQSMCNKVVETYEPQLIQMLLSSFTAEQICARLNMCTDVPVPVNDIQQSANVNKTRCFLCKLIINQVKSMLSDHTTQDEIKAALEKVCDLLPPFFKSVCNNVIETYEPQLIQMLLSSFTAEQICARLNMCTDMIVTVNEMQPSPSMNGISKCSMCTQIFKKVWSMLSKHTTQDQIKAALEKVCNTLTPFLRPLCKSVIKQYEPQLIKMLLSSFTPEQICAQLKLCKKIQDNSQFLMFVPENTESSDTLSSREHCNTCLLTLYHFQSTLSNPNWQSESRAGFHEFCNYFKDDRELCELLVDSSFHGMVRYIQDLRFPVELCRTADFCESTEFVTDDALISDSFRK